MASGRTFAAACLAMLASASCATAEPEAGSVAVRSIEIAAADGTAHALLFHPSERGRRWPALVVWADGSGLRPAYAEIGRTLAAEGYVVLMPNAFYRSAQLDGAVAAPALPADQARERSADWRVAASEEAIMRDARAYLSFLDAQPQTATGAKAGMLGFDYGAAQAFQAARAAPGRIGAVAVLYPSGTATPRPNSPHLFVGESRAAYYVALARNDDAREPGDKDDYRDAFARAGLAAAVEVLPADHGFALADDPAYDRAGGVVALAKALDLFREHLR